jgi:ferredoxin, 2Fe-2S
VPRVIYEPLDGPPTEIEAPLGATARDVALAHGVDGIVGECGGQLMCASCHVYVDEAFLDLLPPRSEDEEEMLESTASPRLPNSRLSCQIKLTEELDGLILRLPAEQL